MNAKITLYSEKSLIEDMKEYAKMHNTSVSKMVTSFFQKTLKKKEKTSDLMSLQGIIKGKIPEDVDPMDIYHQALEEKYL